MTSQILAIFYLNDLDHYIKNELKIKYYVRYQDDFLLFHENKDYLKYCLEKIKEFLANEKLSLNKKTRIYKSTNNFIFLGRSRKNKYARYRTVSEKLKKRYANYQDSTIDLNSMSCSLINYKSLCKRNKLYFRKE